MLRLWKGLKGHNNRYSDHKSVLLASPQVKNKCAFWTKASQASHLEWKLSRLQTHYNSSTSSSSNTTASFNTITSSITCMIVNSSLQNVNVKQSQLTQADTREQQQTNQRARHRGVNMKAKGNEASSPSDVFIQGMSSRRLGNTNHAVHCNDHYPEISGAFVRLAPNVIVYFQAGRPRLTQRGSVPFNRAVIHCDSWQVRQAAFGATSFFPFFFFFLSTYGRSRTLAKLIGSRISVSSTLLSR